MPLVAVVLAGCAGPQSLINGAGTGTRQMLSVWWLMSWLGSAVFVGVMALLVWSVMRGRSPEGESRGRPTKARSRMVLLGGVVLPLVVIAIVFGFSTRGLLAIGDLRGQQDVTIDVVGHQYWWEITYPDEGVVTANAIHIPVNKAVDVRLTSSDVIHSFWIPSIHGKIDMMPGHTTSITLNAEKPGTYRGQCAQFCGSQHANMAFIVVVHDDTDYRAWVDQQSQAAEVVPEGSNIQRGQDVFMSSPYVYCHTIQGTAAQWNERTGPDAPRQSGNVGCRHAGQHPRQSRCVDRQSPGDQAR